MSASAPTSSATRYILIAIALIAVAAIMWLIADVFVIAFGGIVFATVLHVLIKPLQRVTGWSRRWSLVAVVLGLLVVFGLFGWLFGHQAAQQFAEMRERLPAALEKFEAWLGESKFGRAMMDTLRENGADGGKTLSSAGLAAGAVVGGIANFLLILFVGIYFAADPGLYRSGVLRLLPPARRPRVGHALEQAGGSLQKWLVAQLIVMAAVGVLTGVGLAVVGVPLSMSLGLLAGLLEFVPVVGPIASAIPGVLLAFAKGPETALYALAVYVAVQQIESNLLTPLVQRWAVELPPVVALLSIVACGLLFGVLGVIFATPIAVVVLVLVKHLYVEDALEQGAERPAPKSKRNAD